MNADAPDQRRRQNIIIAVVVGILVLCCCCVVILAPVAWSCGDIFMGNATTCDWSWLGVSAP